MFSAIQENNLPLFGNTKWKPKYKVNALQQLQEMGDDGEGVLCQMRSVVKSLNKLFKTSGHLFSTQPCEVHYDQSFDIHKSHAWTGWGQCKCHSCFTLQMTDRIKPCHQSFFRKLPHTNINNVLDINIKHACYYIKFQVKYYTQICSVCSFNLKTYSTDQILSQSPQK